MATIPPQPTKNKQRKYKVKTDAFAFVDRMAKLLGGQRLAVFPVRWSVEDGALALPKWKTITDYTDGQWARAEGYGIIVGGNLTVLDLDSKDELNQAKDLGLLEVGMVVDTPSGGCHIYLDTEGGAGHQTQGKPRAGVDWRGNNDGFVVGPGSVRRAVTTSAGEVLKAGGTYTVRATKRSELSLLCDSAFSQYRPDDSATTATGNAVDSASAGIAAVVEDAKRQLVEVFKVPAFTRTSMAPLEYATRCPRYKECGSTQNSFSVQAYQHPETGRLGVRYYCRKCDSKQLGPVGDWIRDKLAPTTKPQAKPPKVKAGGNGPDRGSNRNDWVRHIASAGGSNRHCYTKSGEWFVRGEGELWVPDPEGFMFERELLYGDLQHTGSGLSPTALVQACRAPLYYGGAWDSQPNLIGLRNHTIFDVATGKARKPTAKDRVSKMLGVVPAQGECPHFLGLLKHIAPTQQAQDYLLAWLGIALTGYTDARTFLFQTGPKRSGKSELMRTIASIAGDYGATIPEQVFAAPQPPHPEWLARLHGVRFLYLDELTTNYWKNVGPINTLISGNIQTARLMRENSFEFKSQAHLMVAGNNKPAIGAMQEGFFDRMALVPTNALPQVDERYHSKLETELPAIAHILLESACGCYADREATGTALPPVPTEWATAKANYTADVDLLGTWCKDNLEEGTSEEDFVAKPALLAKVNQALDLHLRQATRIVETLKAQGYKVTETVLHLDHQGRRSLTGKSTRCLAGVRFKSQQQALDA